MKRNISIVALAVLQQLLFIVVLLLPTTVVDARDIIKVILNDGVMPTLQGDYCNDHDISLIDAVISGDIIFDDGNNNGGDDSEDSEDGEDDRRRRQQRGLLRNTQSRSSFIKVMRPIENDIITTRDLTSYSRRCATYCQGYARGTCRASRCIGYRRELRSSNVQQRQRQLNNICDENIRRVMNGLISIESQVSSSCQKVLQCDKQITCFDEDKYAMIESFTLWNTETKQIVQENLQNNITICIRNNNATSTPRYNIEAIPNACVREVRIGLTGPNNIALSKLREDGPYTIFGSASDGNYNALYGRRLSIGTYELTTDLQNGFSPNKNLKFHVVRCE